MSRRPRKRTGSLSLQSFAWSSSSARREADLFWNDLMGVRPARSADFRQRGAESAFVEQAPAEWQESDEADPWSMPDETFGSDNVRISLRNEDGTPAAGVAFRAQFRDGHVENGTLDVRGEATIADHTHGDVQVTFPALPAASWDISSFGGSGG